MRKMMLLFCFLFFSFGLKSFAQTYPLVTVEDIQFQSDSSLLANGDQPSPLNGDTVRVRGTVLVAPLVDPQNDRRVIIWSGAAWNTYIQDDNGVVYEMFDGITMRQGDTTGAAQGTFFDLVDTAQVVEFTIVVDEFIETTQGALLVDPVTPVQIISNEPKRPDPIELEISDFYDSQQNVLAEKYEGMYVIIRNVVTSDRNVATGTFRINDGNGNFMYMYDQSGYFTLRTSHRLTGLTDYQPPPDGTVLSYIRGVIQTRWGGSAPGYHIIPMYPGDIDISAQPPTISMIRRNLAEVMTNQSVDISASIVDTDGTVDSARLYYRIDGSTFNMINLTSSGSDIYSGTIPGVNSDSALVDFYVWAKDDSGNVSTVPPSPDTNPQYFYLVLNRNVSIQDVQYNPFGTDISGYNGYYVTLNGIVTADTSDFPGTGVTAYQIYMQNGTGPWSGIRVGTRGSLSNDVSALAQGDNVTLTGYVWDGPISPTFNVTRIDSVTSLTVNSQNNPLPDFEVLGTGDIGLAGNGDPMKEQWESVLVKYLDVTVTDENADGPPNNFGEMLVDDNSGDTRVELEDGFHSYHNLSDPTRPNYIRTGNTFEELNGVMYYSFGNYKLVPRNDNDFVGWVTDVNEADQLPDEFGLFQNHPNPFNPSTIINYNLPVQANVTLKIFNILGQEVKTLIDNEIVSAGKHEVSFNANGLPTGIYIYNLQANDFVQSKKMILLK